MRIHGMFVAAVAVLLGASSVSKAHHVNGAISDWIRAGCPNWFAEPPPEWLDGRVVPAKRLSAAVVLVTIDHHHEIKMPISACVACQVVPVGQSFTFRFADFHGGDPPDGDQNVCGALD